MDPELEDEPQAPPKKPGPSRLRRLVARLLLFTGASAMALAVLLMLSRKPAPAPAREKAAAEGKAFVGHHGYIMSMPPGYTALVEFKDRSKSVEVVHFYRSGTDPTNLLDEGLYGQLGIVRMEVRPSLLAGSLDSLDRLTNLVTSRAQQRGEKFRVKNIHVSSLHGVEVTYEAPFPRVEAYVLGQKVLYSFLAGEDDEIYRALLMSLRDAHSET